MIHFLSRKFLKNTVNRKKNGHGLENKNNTNSHGYKSPLWPLDSDPKSQKLARTLNEVVIENCKVNLLYLHLLDLKSEETDLLRQWYTKVLRERENIVNDAHDYLVEGTNK